MGEKGNVKGEITEMFFGFGVLIVYVDEVADQLEGIKRNTDGKQKFEGIVLDIGDKDTGQGEQRAPEKIDVLVYHEERQSRDQSEYQQEFPAAFGLGFADFESHEINDNGGDDQQDEVFFFPIPVEKIAGGQEEHPLEFLRYKKVDCKDNAKKDKKID